MNLKQISAQIEGKLSEIFAEERSSGLPEREDSRAFGAMVEKKIADNWDKICAGKFHLHVAAKKCRKTQRVFRLTQKNVIRPYHLSERLANDRKTI